MFAGQEMPRFVFLFNVLLIIVVFDGSYKIEATVCQAGSQVTARKFSQIIHNYNITGPVFSTITAANPRECEMECHLADPDVCGMLNYYPDTRVCELLYKDRPTEYKVKKKNGAMFKTMKCRDNQCRRNGEYCYSLSSHDNTCLCTNATTCLGVKATPSPVCYSAVNKSFGSFYVPQKGQVRTFRMVHVSGGLKYHAAAIKNNWGSSKNKNQLNTIVTNENNSRICPPPSYPMLDQYMYYNIVGYDDSSPEIILPDIKPPLSVVEGQELRVWFGEDYSPLADAVLGNGGTSCADVYLYYY